MIFVLGDIILVFDLIHRFRESDLSFVSLDPKDAFVQETFLIEFIYTYFINLTSLNALRNI